MLLILYLLEGNLYADINIHNYSLLSYLEIHITIRALYASLVEGDWRFKR